MPKIARPTRPCDLVLRSNDKFCEVQMWLDEDLFYIDNGYLEDNECIGQIRLDGKRYFKVLDFLEAITTTEDVPQSRRSEVLTFLLERGILDSTEPS